MIAILDDLIPKHLQDYLELIALGQNGREEEVIHPMIDFRVKYETTGLEDGIRPLSFVHVLKSDSKVSQHFENFALIPQIVCDHFNWILRDFIVARMYLILPYETKLEHYAPHVDWNIPHTVVLYYLNDSDGDTVFFDNQGNITQRVSPKKGRVLVFDGQLYHGGGIPKHSPRCVVNFDILVKEK